MVQTQPKVMFTSTGISTVGSSWVQLTMGFGLLYVAQYVRYASERSELHYRQD